MTWFYKLTNHNILMINIMSPITTSIRTITRKSVNISGKITDMKKMTKWDRVPSPPLVGAAFSHFLLGGAAWFVSCLSGVAFLLSFGVELLSFR